MGKEKRKVDLITHGLYILGVKNIDKVNFMTAAWVTQISARPHTILVAIGSSHYTADMIERAQVFSVNVLNPEQRELAVKCGSKSGRDTDKSQYAEYKFSDNKVPILNESAGYLTCQLKKVVEYGDHKLFLAEVIEGQVTLEDGMVYKEEEFF